MSDFFDPATAQIPEPTFDGDDDPFVEGDAIVMPVPAGPEVRLRFPSPYESILTLAGDRVQEDRSPATRDLLLWMSRRLPALWRSLDVKRGLLGVLQGRTVLVHDVVDLEVGGFLDHGQTRQVLEPARVTLPHWALLGTISTKGEVSNRTRGMYAAGTTVEVRVEEAGRVQSRRRFRVGR